MNRTLRSNGSFNRGLRPNGNFDCASLGSILVKSGDSNAPDPSESPHLPTSEGEL